MTTKNERPILFNAHMVRAILDGRKTQTRRLVGLDTFRPSTTTGYAWTFRGQAPIRSIAQQRQHRNGCWQDLRHEAFLALCPYGAPGDRLWVRETFYCDHSEYPRGDVDDMRRMLDYRATHECATYEAGCPCEDDAGRSSWRPSIHMPRWASRITLEVTGVRIERLQDISEADARAEGVAPADWPTATTPHRAAFIKLWEEINTHRAPWASNPWVWVVEFKRVGGQP